MTTKSVHKVNDQLQINLQTLSPPWKREDQSQSPVSLNKGQTNHNLRETLSPECVTINNQLVHKTDIYKCMNMEDKMDRHE